MTVRRNLLVLVVALAALPATAFAQDLKSEISTTAAQKFETQADQLYAYEITGDPVGKMELAQMLMRGTQISATNPLLRPDLDRAEKLLDEVAAGDDPALALRALDIKMDLLSRRGTPEALAERDEISKKLLAEHYAPAIATQVLSGAALPEDVSHAEAVAALEAKVLVGDANATMALSELLAKDDPARSAALKQQALVLLMVGAQNSIKGSADLGRRYLSGDGVAADSAEGLRLLQNAAEKGSNEALLQLNDAVIAHAPGLDVASVKALITKALSAGSSKAADIIVADYLEQPVYGFSKDEALYALALLGETGNREALLKMAQFYAAGRGAAPDLKSAIPIIEQLVDVNGQPQSEIMRLALKLEAIGLPLTLSLKYVVPLYGKITGINADEAGYHASRLLAAAAEAGIPEALKRTPDQVTDTLRSLKAAGLRGHAASWMLLGDLYYAGIWVNLNYRQALQYYEQSLQLEPGLVAKERVAKALFQSKSTPFEEARFNSLIGELASAGSQWGQYRSALLQIDGDGTTPPDVVGGEAKLLALSTQGFAPAVRAMIARLKDVHDNARLDQAIVAFSGAWTQHKDYRTGKQLADFYILAQRIDEARAVLGDPMYAEDAEAILALARIDATGPTPDEQRAFATAQRGLQVATDPQDKVAIAAFLTSLTLAQAKDTGQQVLDAMAASGDTDAIGLLVNSYLARLDTDKSLLPTVLDWTLTLAKTGEVAPILQLAATYLAKDADPTIAAAVLPVAESAVPLVSKDSYLPTLVAQAYYGGWGTKPDVKKGNALIENAAAGGSADALAELGLQYFYGMGRDRDPNTGVALLDSAAALGHSVARVELGRLYSSAIGPGVDRVKAYSMFLEAANQGSRAGMLEVGRLYLAGWGIGADEAKGVEWLQRAASLGNYDAMYQLYFHYHFKPDEESQQLAREWLDKSVEAGVNPARLRLAVHLLSTEGDTPGTTGYDDAISLLDDAFAAGYNKARKFRQTTTDFDLPLQGETAEVQP